MQNIFYYLMQKVLREPFCAKLPTKYQNHLNYKDEHVERMGKFYVKLWSIIRFCGFHLRY